MGLRQAGTEQEKELVRVNKETKAAWREMEKNTGPYEASEYSDALAITV